MGRFLIKCHACTWGLDQPFTLRAWRRSEPQIPPLRYGMTTKNSTCILEGQQRRRLYFGTSSASVIEEIPIFLFRSAADKMICLAAWDRRVSPRRTRWPCACLRRLDAIEFLIPGSRTFHDDVDQLPPQRSRIRTSRACRIRSCTACRGLLASSHGSFQRKHLAQQAVCRDSARSRLADQRRLNLRRKLQCHVASTRRVHARWDQRPKPRTAPSTASRIRAQPTPAPSITGMRNTTLVPRPGRLSISTSALSP